MTMRGESSQPTGPGVPPGGSWSAPAGQGPGDPSPPEPRVRVLVVDDEPSVADVCREFLSDEGYDVTVAASGEEALRLIPILTPDVILTDINLPGVSGLEVMRHARSADPDACIIVVTGYASTASAIDALRQGAYEYVTKPFDLMAVQKIVKSGSANRRLKLSNRHLIEELSHKNEILSHHEQELRERVRIATQQLSRLYEVGKEISTSLELGPRLSVMVARAADMVEAPGAAIYLRDDTTEEYRAVAGHGIALAPLVDDVPHLTLASDHPLARCAIRQAPVTAGGEAPIALPGFAGADVECLIAVPLVTEGAVVGVLAVFGKPGGFTADDQDVLTLFASQAAIALRNSQLYEHAKSLDRLKSEFVAVVSHEIRTPLTSVKGAIELLADEHYFQNNEQQMKLLTIAHANAERLLVLISDILDFSKLESSSLPMNMETQRIEPVLQQAAHNLRTLIEERQIQLEVVLAPDLPDLMMDANRITQVVTNLLSNAIKFSTEGGRIEVMADLDDGAVRVSVRDHGEGIAAQSLPKLFQKFSQVDSSATRRAGGTGLGLVICKGIIEQHGGIIQVESTPGLGSTFYFVLPSSPPVATPEHAG
jgi:signal transduction histidine kinase/DNA-binding response OmpR family regulator